MPLNTSTQDREVLLHTVKTLFLLELTLVWRTFYNRTSGGCQHFKLFRIISVLLIGCFVFALSGDWTSYALKSNDIFYSKDDSLSFGQCSIKRTGTFYIGATVLVPLYELVVYPVFHKCILSTFKFTTGALIGMAKHAIYVALILTARQEYIHSDMHVNETLHSIFHEPKGALSGYIDYKSTLSLHECCILSDGHHWHIGILSAQAPYSMRGLVIGLTYGLLAVYISAVVTAESLFSSKSFTWGTGVTSCGFWYSFLVLISLVIALMMFAIVRSVTKRERERMSYLINIIIFA